MGSLATPILPVLRQQVRAGQRVGERHGAPLFHRARYAADRRPARGPYFRELVGQNPLMAALEPSWTLAALAGGAEDDEGPFARFLGSA
jgi:hypothetical protein